MKEKFSITKRISKITYDNVEKEILERHLIIELLSNIPVEKLKSILDFSLINPENNELWSYNNIHLRHILEDCKCHGQVEYRAEIKL